MPGYALEFVPGTLTIDRAPLVIRVNNATRMEGKANPQFSATIEGLASFDSPSSLGRLRFSTTANESSSAGRYAIAAAGAASDNYDITYDFGTLTVTPAPARPVAPGIDLRDYTRSFTLLGAALQDVPQRHVMLRTGSPAEIRAGEARSPRWLVPRPGELYFRDSEGGRLFSRSAGQPGLRVLAAASSFDPANASGSTPTDW